MSENMSVPLKANEMVLRWSPLVNIDTNTHANLNHKQWTLSRIFFYGNRFAICDELNQSVMFLKWFDSSIFF